MDLHKPVPDGMTEHDKICSECRESLKKSLEEPPRETIQTDLFCKHCGTKLPSQDADICTHCGKLVKVTSFTVGETASTGKSPSDLWYLLPIFFGIIGGLVMFFVLKDENRKMAKNGIILGAIIAVIGLVIISIIYAGMFSSL